MCILGVAFVSTSLEAEDVLLGVVHFDLRASELETIDVTEDGLLLAGISPVAMPDLRNGREGFHAGVPVVLHRPGFPQPFFEIPKVRIGPGEGTDVAISPDRSFIVANVWDDDLHDRNQLLLIRGQGVSYKVNFPDSADGIGMSPNGQYVVVAERNTSPSTSLASKAQARRSVSSSRSESVAKRSTPSSKVKRTVWPQTTSSRNT